MGKRQRVSVFTVIVLLVFCVFGIDPVAAANSKWYVKGVTYPMDINGIPYMLTPGASGEDGPFGVNVQGVGGDFEGILWVMAHQNYHDWEGKFVDTNDVWWYIKPNIVRQFTNSVITSWRPTIGEKPTDGGTYGFIVFDKDMEYVSVTNIEVPKSSCIWYNTLPDYWNPDTGNLTIGGGYQNCVGKGADWGRSLQYGIVNMTEWRSVSWGGFEPGYQLSRNDLWACYKDGPEGRVAAKCDGTETGTVAIEKGIIAVRVMSRQRVWDSQPWTVAVWTHYIAFGYKRANPWGDIIVNLPSKGYVGVKVSGAAYPSIDRGIDYKCKWSVPGWLHANGCRVEGVPTASGTFGWSVQLSATGYETLKASGWIDILPVERVIDKGGVGVGGDIVRTLGIEGTRLANFVGVLDSHRVNLLNAVRSVNDVIGSLSIVDFALDVKKYVSFGMKLLPPHTNIILSLVPVVFGVKFVMWIVGAVKGIIKWW